MTGTSDVLTLTRVVGSLVVVLLVAVLAARIARRAGRRGGTAALAVRERIGLTRDASAVVLQVGDRLLLLGVSARGVTVLADLSSGAAVTGPALPAAAQVAPLVVAPPASPSTARAGHAAIPAQRTSVRVVTDAPPAPPLTRRELRAVSGRRRPAVPPSRRSTGTGSVLDPRTWQQGLEALRDLTARRG